ncbi:MAG: L-lactate permease, partial [Acidocella sp.]|nr:L-lactate permease [Acidocella sp.]
TQFVTSNFIDYALTDVLSSMGSLIATLLFLRAWHPAPDAEFAISAAALEKAEQTEVHVAPWQGWIPWIVVSATVIAWTTCKVAAIGQQAVHWPGLDKAISITLYQGKPYAAVWNFQPLGTGTAILLAAVVCALLFRLSPAAFFGCIGKTIRQAWVAVITVMFIIGLAYLMNYSGLA